MAPVNPTIYNYGRIVAFLVSTNSGGDIAPPVDKLKDFLKLDKAWRGGSMRPRRDKADHVMDFMKFFTPAYTNSVKLVEDARNQQHAVWDAFYGSMSPCKMKSITRMSVEVKDPEELTGEFLKLPAAPPERISWADTERLLETELKNEDHNFIVRPPPPPTVTGSLSQRGTLAAARNVRSVHASPRHKEVKKKSTSNSVANLPSPTASTNLNKSPDTNSGVAPRRPHPSPSTLAISSRNSTPELHSPDFSCGDEDNILPASDLTKRSAMVEAREQRLQTWWRMLEVRAQKLAQREGEMHRYYHALQTWASDEAMQSLFQNDRLGDVRIWISKMYQTIDFGRCHAPLYPGPRFSRPHPRAPSDPSTPTNLTSTRPFPP